MPDPARRADLAVLTTAAAAGDEEAWDALVRRFDPVLRRIARGFRLSPEQVDDAVQATWLRAVRYLERLEDPSAVGAWLMTTARRESLRTLQTEAREVPTDEPIDPQEPDQTSPDAVGEPAEEERIAVVRAALGALPPRQRAVLEMLVREPPVSYEEVAAMLAMPVGSVGPTRGRALARLRRDPPVARAAAWSNP